MFTGDEQEGGCESELHARLVSLFASRMNYQVGYSLPPKSQLKAHVIREIIRTKGEFGSSAFFKTRQVRQSVNKQNMKFSNAVVFPHCIENE